MIDDLPVFAICEWFFRSVRHAVARSTPLLDPGSGRTGSAPTNDRRPDAAEEENMVIVAGSFEIKPDERDEFLAGRLDSMRRASE